MDTNNCNKDNVGKDKIFTKNNTNSREMKDVCEIISFNIRKGMTSKYKFEQIKLILRNISSPLSPLSPLLDKVEQNLIFSILN